LLIASIIDVENIALSIICNPSIELSFAKQWFRFTRMWGSGFNKVPCTRINRTLISAITYSLPYIILADQLEHGEILDTGPRLDYEMQMADRECARMPHRMMTSSVLRDIIQFLKDLISCPDPRVFASIWCAGVLISCMSAFDTDQESNVWWFRRRCRHAMYFRE
jgi:hypothetical protein